MKYIADVLVAVSGTKRSFYLPCIVFGRNGRYLSSLKVGTKLKLRGRFQSRNYIAEADPSNEVKTAYEIAVSAYELNEWLGVKWKYEIKNNNGHWYWTK